MRIQANPEQLRATAQLLRQAETEWQAQAARLRAQFEGLDWDASQKLAVEEQFQLAARLAQDLASRALEKALFLENAAARFEQADGQGAAALAVGIAAPISGLLQGWSALPAWTQARLGGLNAWERLSASLGAPLGGVTPLPVSGGNMLLGISALASLPLLGSTAQKFIETIWNWLHGYGWWVNNELISSLPAKNDTQVSKGKLHENVMNGLDKNTSPSASSSESPSQVVQNLKEEAQPTAPSFGHPVSPASQQGLKYRGQNTQYGCTAASTSMVLEYWHGKNQNAGTLSAQEILDANVRQGKFSGTGLSISEVHDEVQALGYSTVEDRINVDFETLKQDVHQGPVVAIVKLGMQKSGYNHAVVVTGISDSGQVSVNDPWDGQKHIYSSAEFQSSWGADFGGGLKNMYAVIRP